MNLLRRSMRRAQFRAEQNEDERPEFV